MDNWDKNFRELLNSPFGKELVRSLKEDLHGSLISQAESAETQESAFGLLKEASGVIKAIGHLQFRAVAPKDETGKKQ